MVKKERKALADILINSGRITKPQIMDAISIQVAEGKSLEEVLVENKMVLEVDITNAMLEQRGIEKVDLNNVEFDKKSIKLVPENLCNKYALIPFGFKHNKIKVAFEDPLNMLAIDDVSISTGLEVLPFIATKNDIKRSIEVNYSSEQVNAAAEELLKETMVYKEVEEDIEEMDNIKNAPVVKMIDQLFKNAVEMRASDIHIERYETEVRIRYRIDGKLQTINKLGIESLTPLVARIKILSNLNIAERRVPQDGKIITRVGEEDVDLRVSILPVVNGEKVVIRILDRKNYKLKKELLGFSSKNMKKLENIIACPNGIILVTGPTGSGKSTTLYTVLSELNSDEVNIVTIEDPVEYTLSGINQVSVNSKTGMTFANSLRSVLRQDPDIVMIGEIRDNETAQIAIKAAITGHFVLSTIHTNDAPSSITRLIDMGIEPYLISTSLVGVIAQRLVRKICPYCEESYEASNYEKRVLKQDEDKPLVLHRGKGCGHCNNTGYYGRIGVYEIMELQRAHREAITKNINSDFLRDIAKENGMITLEEECRTFVLRGITTVKELATITLLKDA